MGEMTEQEAIEVVKQARKILGRRYKSDIWAAWFNGSYYAHGLENLSSPLQRVRNEFGPSWLNRLRLPKEG